jgi:hypothetical protein
MSIRTCSLSALIGKFLVTVWHKRSSCTTSCRFRCRIIPSLFRTTLQASFLRQRELRQLRMLERPQRKDLALLQQTYRLPAHPTSAISPFSRGKLRGRPGKVLISQQDSPNAIESTLHSRLTAIASFRMSERSPYSRQHFTYEAVHV